MNPRSIAGVVVGVAIIVLGFRDHVAHMRYLRNAERPTREEIRASLDDVVSRFGIVDRSPIEVGEKRPGLMWARLTLRPGRPASYVDGRRGMEADGWRYVSRERETDGWFCKGHLVAETWPPKQDGSFVVLVTWGNADALCDADPDMRRPGEPRG